VLFAGILQVAAGQLPVGTLLVVLTYVYNLYAPVEELAQLASVLARGSASAGRLVEILGSTEMVTEAPEALEAPPGPPALALRAVRFSYREGTPALTDLCLEVGSGEAVAVVGPSGAGKSTLLALLLRLYDPDEGSIELGGLDLRRLTLQSLRERITLVPQDPWILDGTIEENIIFGRPDVTAEELQRAAARSLVDEFVERLPEGYATGVGEGGALLSGGQRRRIALARAILREEASLLILDEPTSGLDHESEALVVAGLKRAMEGRTTVIVSHALAVAALADRVVILEGGRVLGEGPPDELFAQGRTHAALWSLHGRVPSSPPIPADRPGLVLERR
jgi:ATP-binding cassette subfamily B protein